MECSGNTGEVLQKEDTATNLKPSSVSSFCLLGTFSEKFSAWFSNRSRSCLETPEEGPTCTAPHFVFMCRGHLCEVQSGPVLSQRVGAVWSTTEL